MELTFSDASFGPTTVPAPYDLQLGVEATFRLVSSEGRVLYEEELCPVVELAVALEEWLSTGLDAGTDLSFVSVESDEAASLWCRRQGDGWRVGSSLSTVVDPACFSTREVRDAFATFVGAVAAWLEESLGRTFDEARHRPRGGDGG